MRIRSGGSITIDGRTFTDDVVIDRKAMYQQTAKFRAVCMGR